MYNITIIIIQEVKKKNYVVLLVLIIQEILETCILLDLPQCGFF